VLRVDSDLSTRRRPHCVREVERNPLVAKLYLELDKTKVRDLAQAPGDRAVRQRAVNGVLKSARRLRADDRVHDAAPDSTLTATVPAMRSAGSDIMVFTGIDADQAAQEIQHDDADLDVPTLAPTPRTQFKRPRLPWKQTEH
jgi:plasmid stabilization system protein ParE